MANDDQAQTVGAHPESAEWFREQLTALGLRQVGLARWMVANGDDRKEATILRHVQRMAAGEAAVTGEMRVILGLMRSGAGVWPEKKAKG